MSVRPNLRLFSVFGVQLTMSWSWLLMLGLVVYVAEDTFGGIVPRLPSAATWGLAVLAAVLSAASLYAHELAHALTAMHFGLRVRTVNLFLLGGMAQIGQESPSPRAEVLIALAGPTTSLAIGFAGIGLSLVAGTIASPVGAIGVWLAFMNVPLAVFNLVPAYPLDGGRVLRGMLWFAGQDLRWGSTVSARSGQVAAGVLLFAGLYELVTETGLGFSGIWLILVAWFLYAGAVSAHRTAVFVDGLRKLPVAAIMQRRFGRVEAGVSLQSFAEQHLTRASNGEPGQSFGVYRDEQLVGLVGLPDLRRVPAAFWGSATVERVMQPIATAPRLEPGASAVQAFHLLVGEGSEQLAVMAEDRLLGIVSRADLARAAADPRPLQDLRNRS